MIPLLTTKLYIPPPRPQAVLRPRLVERLNAGLHCKMTLISAPAGFGKTTLVSAWIAGCGRPAAWLSLEEADSDGVRFLVYVVAALRTIAPQVGEDVLAALQSPQPPPTASVLTALLNEITALPHSFVLVLDDYHVIDAQAVDQALIFLLEHLPPQMHLAIATREDPQLPLPRLRAKGQMTELRAADLRFTPTEAVEFLNRVMGLQLAAGDIAALEERTEGWIAGLQLAALSVQGRQDVGEFIRAFAGDHRYIVDYLVEEVLGRQPAPLRSFLLQTAILDRLHGALCDAVTGQQDGQARLEALERSNFFVVPLDDKRHWYRYHHLFGGVLQAHLLAEQPDQVPALHRRASTWYAGNGLPAAAIRHALTAADFERAADLIEGAIPAMRRDRQDALLFGWLKALPIELLRHRPALGVQYAGHLLLNGEIDAAAAWLRDVERRLEAAAQRDERPGDSPAGLAAMGREEMRSLGSSIAMYRAAIALVLGDVAGTLQSARRAIELAPAEDHFGRGSAAGFLGLAHWTNGELAAAYHWYAECLARMQRAGHVADTFGCSLALADIRLAQGRLSAALRTYEGALQTAAAHGAHTPRGTADMYVGMSGIYRERNDLVAAAEQLLRSRELGELAGAPQNPYRWCAAMAALRQAHGDLDGALDLLGEAERLYVGDFFPNEHPIAARKARVWLRQGRLGEALAWVRERGLSAQDDLSYLREFEHITLARVLLARHQVDAAGGFLPEAGGLLERLLHAAEAGERARSAIEILLLQALSLEMQGDIPASLLPLQRALELAEPEDYVRLFVDEGMPMERMLRQAAERGIAPGYAGRLLAALGVAHAGEPPYDPLRSPGVRIEQEMAPPLLEPLSERELEVLHLLATDLDGPEIARRLVVSLNTMRTHTKNIYAKLGVNTRRAATTRARQLGLL